MNKVEQLLKQIYKDEYNDAYYSVMQVTINKFRDRMGPVKKIDEKNVYMITYADSFTSSNKNSIKQLEYVADTYFKNIISDIHILPMFEYTSDDGFSVVDYMKVKKEYGTWDDIQCLSKKYNLMFDFVANHMSKSSPWFSKFLKNDPEYKNFFIEEDKTFDTTKVVRPRTSPLFHSYDKTSVWTTFSEDQVDLNYKNIHVLVKATEVLLEYVANGATSIRLDAIGFLWKESGTTCMHLEETHNIIKLWRHIIEDCAKNVQIITETNVPHEENISYFGNGDEANQVYQFALPPLVLHSFISGNSQKLSAWASTITKVGDNETYFNFLASHDGIGMRPVENILSLDEKERIFSRVKANGGLFNYKTAIDGSQEVYELNISYYDALATYEDDEVDIKRFIAAHSIMCSLIGVPAIYYNSLLGTQNNLEEVNRTNINRRINRLKYSEEMLEKHMKKEKTEKILKEFSILLKARRNEKAFNPYGTQEVIDVNEHVFCVKRKFENDEILCMVNLSNMQVSIPDIEGFNILTDKKFTGIMEPYEYVWIK